MADDFSPQIASLTPGMPIVLLPVRLETRFFDNGNELRIRIYPDQIHADAHEPELTAGERDAGMVYWRAIFASPDPKKRKPTPWADLCAIVGAPRAAWVVRALTPTNVAALGKAKTPAFPDVALRASEWGRAARAALLPKRWLVSGLSADADFFDPPTVLRFYEKFRKWSNEVSPALDLTPDPEAEPVTDGTALALQPAAKWLVDFDEAERVGMAVRIFAADCINGQKPGDGINRLHVFGVDWTQTPEASAAALRQLMHAHVYTDGLSAIAPGTPTNATADMSAGAAPTSAAWTAALDPEHRPTAAAVAGHASDRLWRDLGIVPMSDDLLTAYPNANSSDALVTSHLINAIWESTLGAFATTAMPALVNDTMLADARDHARRFLQPAGPYPALRIGRQPYGVLPIVAGRTMAKGETPIETQLLTAIGKLEGIWRQCSADHVPRMGHSSNVEGDLVALLQRQPVSGTYQYRAVVDRGTARSASALQLTPFSDAQDWTNSLLWQYLNSAATPAPMSAFSVHPTPTRLGVPLVAAQAVAAGSPLATNYLKSIAALARADGTFDAIKARESATTVLEALVANAAARELHRADMRTINNYLISKGLMAALPPIGLLQVSASPFGWPAPDPVSGTTIRLVNASQASRVVIPTVTGTQTVRQFVTNAIPLGGKVAADYSSLNDMVTSLEWLATQPADQLERCLRSVLDGFAYRLDAWITSLASRRLASSRSTHPTGVYVGAYGWLDNVAPAPIPTSLGYVHTPSLAQATTAAVLRSGHLAHTDAEHEAFNIDLSADRVRLARQILEGVAQGQPLAAILGYQFERSVRSASLTLAQYILPFRRLVPLRAGDAGDPAMPASPSDNIAARDVVDGVALVERWQNEKAKLLSALVPTPNTADQTALGAVLDGLANAYDAVADVMIAESVHQTVLGNAERAGAVLAAIDRQETPPRMDFIQTPRTGTSFTHRVLLLLGDDTIPDAWSTIPLDVRAKAEPRLNAWIARLLGDPARIIFAATASEKPAGTGPIRPPAVITATVSELGLSPLSLVMASEAAGKDSPSELEERIVHAIAAKIAAPSPSTQIALLDEPPSSAAPGAIGLGTCRSLLRWIYRVVTTQRSATANDLALPQDGNDEGLVPAELARRADLIAAEYATLLDTVEHLIVERPADSQSFRDVLWSAAALGVSGAIPSAPSATTPASERDELLARATAVAAAMRAGAARQSALVAGFGSGTGVSPHAAATHHIDRVHVLLGEHFPILPRFSARNVAGLVSSIGDRAVLCAGDDLAPMAWLQRMALVRPGAGALSRVLIGAEMLQTGIAANQMLVVQLPRAAGERWVALPFAGTSPVAELSIAAASSGAIDFTQPLAGLFCDAWPEVVPHREETTGLTFHYDAPGARPPQAILIAAPPESPENVWSVNGVLESVMEARRLAPIRAVTPAELRWMGTTLPPIWLPAATSVDANAMDLGDPTTAPPSTPTSPAAPAVNVLGKA